MAGSVNKVILIGHVGKDPEIRSFQNGNKVANFSLATSESWKDKSSGERKEKTEWHRIAVFNENIVGVVERFVKKGSKLYVEGALETRKWTDQSGQEKFSTEVVIKQFRGEITLLDGKSDGGGQQAPAGSYDQSPPRQSTGSGGGSGHARPRDDIDDEIPFARSDIDFIGANRFGKSNGII